MKINKVIGYSLSSPFKSNVKYFGYNDLVKNIGIVEVHTDSGIVGYGETYSGVYCSELVSPVVEYLNKFLIGKDVYDFFNINQLPFIGRSGLIKSVFSGVEIAIYDIISKVENKSLSNYLNNSTFDFKTYASNGSAMFSPTDIERDVKQIIDLGFDSYKMRIGVQSKEIDLKRLEFARNTLGSDRTLMVDAIMGSNPNTWDYATAKEWSIELKNFNVLWLEEPFVPSDVYSYSKLKHEVDVKIAGGESLNESMEFDLYKNLNAVDIIQPDITNGGGIRECLDVVNKFGNNNTAIHVWGSQIALNVSREFSKAVGVFYLEVPMMNLEINDLIKTSDAGIGIHISDAVKSKYMSKSSYNFKI